MTTSLRIRTALAALVCLLALGAAGPGTADDRLQVVATLADLGWLAQTVGGDDVSVEVLCDSHRDPHTLPAKPSLARKLQKADLLLYNGLELEVGWLPVLLGKARNARLNPGQPGEMDCSTALDHAAILDVPTGDVDRSGGDVHALGNPHYLADPRLGLDVADAIAGRLAQLDPAHAAGYAARAADLRQDLEARLAVWEAVAAALPTRRVIVYHQQWEYLAHWLDLEIIGTIENRPGISPTPKHVEHLIRDGRAQAPVLVLAAPWDHVDAARRVAEEVGGGLAVPPAASPDEGGYPALFDAITAALAAAAAEAAP